KMKKKFRAVIKHLHMKGLTPKEIKVELDNIHVNEFKRGRTSTCDAPRSRRPIEAATPEIIDKVHNIVLTDRRVKVPELVEATDISHDTVISILHEQLARWVPRLLTVDHKCDRVTISKECLEMFQRNPDEFLRRFITMDEIWVHYFTPKMKEYSEEGEDREVGQKGDDHSFLRCTRYNSYRLPSVEANDDYYAALLDRFNNILKKKRSHRIHTCPAAMAKFNEFRYELLPHPAYSPDLASCDYFLFSNEEMVRRKEIHHQRTTHRRNRGLF
ncbi:SETMR methyltransferase, partial [Acromyrmex charruanus]